MDVNESIFTGRLTRDPELKYTKSGKPVCNISVAINGKNETDTSFIDVTVWSNSGENVAKYCKKGSCVLVEGRLNQNRFTDKSGNNRSKIEIIASFVKFLSHSQVGRQVDPDPSVGSYPGDNGGIENEPINFEMDPGEDEVPF